ncbi:hypothetical protein BY458DRAFT_548614 [Sporodiniella umbellata]|nr:hypothetical protein BY458DRAFT_548614 [Sporodiniella umbellata]
MNMRGYRYAFPSIFQRIPNKTSAIVQNLELLRTSKAYRYEKNALVVQGFQSIKKLRDQGFKFKSLIATAKKEPREDREVAYPAKQVIENPDAFPSKSYYLSEIDLTRKVLGTASRPDQHEVYAEVQFPQYELGKGDRWVVFDKVNNAENLGSLVRTAQGLGWDSGIVTSNHSDLYHDFAVRASELATLTWPHAKIGFDKLSDFLKQHQITPIVAETLPKNPKKAWSPEYGRANTNEIKPGSGIWFWNFSKDMPPFPKKIALILSCEYSGVDGSFKDALRVSLPLEAHAKSLDVAAAGSIIMTELSRQRMNVTK